MEHRTRAFFIYFSLAGKTARDPGVLRKQGKNQAPPPLTCRQRVEAPEKSKFPRTMSPAQKSALWRMKLPIRWSPLRME